MATRDPRNRVSKFQKNPDNTPIANRQLLMHGDRMQGEFDFDMRSVHCAWNFDRTEHKELACPIGVLAGLFGTLEPDFSGPKWPFPSILFAKHIKITQSRTSPKLERFEAARMRLTTVS